MRGFYQSALALTALLAVANAQRGSVPACALPTAFSCNHTTTFQPTNLQYQENLNEISFKPEGPGTYTFEYQATDLCKTTSETTSVVARCPPAPLPEARLTQASGNANVVYQNNQAVLTGTTSKAGWSGGSIEAYEWKVIEAPAESDYTISGDVKNGKVLSTQATYTSPKLTKAGQYKFTLGVSDGCSIAMAIVCFTVECNCGPTANAGATTTVWTNAGPDTNLASTNRGDNKAGLNNGKGSGMPYWILDGSLSYDFDANEMLTYEWSFVEWRSVSPQQTWTRTTDVRPSGGRGGGVGYKTTCTPSATGSASFYSSTCSFVEIPQSSSTGGRILDPPDGRALRQSTREIPDTMSTLVIPAYVPNEEDFAIPTTSCKANISTTTSTVYQVTPYEQLITEVSGAVAKENVICQIQIYQQAENNTVARNNPIAYLSVNNLKSCMGLWTFRLTVRDACGSATQSTDDINVHVRCNEPPVAVAACNNTQEWKGSFFDQVRLDGRSSHDKDNFGASLTYTWTFIQNEIPTGHCPKAHVACVEDFCKNPNYFTSASGTDLNLVFGSSAGASSTCAPTVYPVIYDKTLPTTTGCSPPGTCPQGSQCTVCQYQVVAPTQYHVGNSAYFTPSKSGTYHVQLTVDDGCSQATTDVWVFAVCPTMTVSISLSDPTGTIQPGSQPQTELTSTIFYQGSSDFLTYQWTATSSTADSNAALQFTNPTGTTTTAVATVAGSYTIKLTVSDQCQEKSSPSVIWRVVCNTAPTTPQLAMISPSSRGAENIVFFDGVQFPRITINGTSTDTDPLTYSWSINNIDDAGLAGLKVDYGASGATQNQLSFTPPSGVGGSRSYNILATAFDKCTTSLAGQITVQLRCNGTLQANAGRDQSASYDYGNGRFSEVTYSGAASVWPYASVSGASQNWQWSVLYYDTPTQASGSLITTGISGTNSETFRITPVRVGTYRVTLTINDGCANATQTVNLVTRCDTPAIARVASPSVSVEWNSFLGNTGGFGPVELDGSSSQGDSRSTLTYIWKPSVNLVASGGAPSLNTPKVTFTPTAPGTTQFTLQVHNGPCPVSTEARVAVSAVCNTLSALLQTPGTGSGRGSGATSQYQRLVNWDGTRFPTVCLDGTASSYTSRNGTAGKFDTLAYIWQMTAAPLNSMFRATAAPTVVTGGAQQNMSYGVNGFLDEKLPNSTADTTITLRKWEMLTQTTTTTVQTYLNNHHYNRPYTCFRPDLAGAYSITLSITDGCTTSNATASVTARCNSAPVVAFTSPANVQLSGRIFTRVALTAQVSFPAGETLSYQWTLINAPNGSSLKVNSSMNINNNQAPTASFVPDTAGTYTFEFVTMDGCNPEVKQTLNILASCNSLMSISPLSTAPQFIDYSGVSANDMAFTLTGSVNGNCQVISTRWFFKQRTCGTHFVPDARPPPVTLPPVAKGCNPQSRCKWELFEEPCTDVTVNPGYLPPFCGDDASDSLNTACKKTRDFDEKTCEAGRTLSFKCRYPGVYKMKFTVDDGCSTDEEIVTITCRCQKKIKADAGVDRVSLKQCAGANTFAYDEVELSGLVTYDPRDNSIDTVQTCPTAPVETVSCDNVPGDCCPVADECCAPPCPTCPTCPNCPACPTVAGGAAPSGPSPAVPGAAPGQVPGAVPGAVPAASPVVPAESAPAVPSVNVVPGAPDAPVPGAVPGPVPGAPSDQRDVPALVPGSAPDVGAPTSTEAGGSTFVAEDEEEVETALLLGIVIPMSVILVISAIGNIVLFSRMRNAAVAAPAGGDVQMSTSPTSVVVGRSV